MDFPIILHLVSWNIILKEVQIYKLLEWFLIRKIKWHIILFFGVPTRFRRFKWKWTIMTKSRASQKNKLRNYQWNLSYNKLSRDYDATRWHMRRVNIFFLVGYQFIEWKPAKYLIVLKTHFYSIIVHGKTRRKLPFILISISSFSPCWLNWYDVIWWTCWKNIKN